MLLANLAYKSMLLLSCIKRERVTNRRFAS